MIFPFFGQLDLGFFYYVIMILFILFLSNAVNLTDGIDGLAASVTFLVCISVLIMSGVLGLLGIGVYASALAGGLLGFLIYNFHPAKVFMGDTGSMFLGGSVLALGFGINLPVLIRFSASFMWWKPCPWCCRSSASRPPARPDL